MMWLLLGLYAVGAVVIVAVGRGERPGPVVFGIGAAVSTTVAVAATWWLVQGTVATAAVDWVPGLGIELAVRVDPLTSLLTLIVAGIGIGVFVYSAGYFSAGTEGLARFSATLLVFSGSMVGLVLSDSVWALFLFWELTSITSFLLVGFKNVDEAVRVAARRALVITASGGLVLLAGFVVLQDIEGTTRLRDMEPATGFTAGVAAVLAIVAAATKSAQVPFHVWLPGAMAAPTPVSAYLHSATMVKAGVILIAILQPTLGGSDPWTPLLMGFGLTSLIWGAIGALRQFDAKLILAWGTISQLGLMIALLGVDTAKATFAAMAIVVAHAVFKAALFLVVGEIDVRTGTRDVRQLGGLWRTMPITFAVALASALSMAGVPPLLGFTAKEAGIEAALGLEGAEKTLMLVGVVAGSVLTVAYTTRLMVLAFGGPAPDGLVVAPRRWAMSGVEVVLGTLSLAGFVFLGSVTGIVRDAAVVLEPAAEVYELLRWPGLTTAFVISLAIVVVGFAVGLLAVRGVSRAARPLGALMADNTIEGTLFVSRAVASRVQHGSLPGYMVTAALVAALAAIPFVVDVDLEALVEWDHPAQLGLGILILAAAIGVSWVPNRLGAAVGLGAVGFGVAGLFVVHGAPDLALTQLLVETVIVVGFVVGLGRLGTEFPQLGQLWRSVRLLMAGLVGVGVAVGLAAAGSAPTGTPPVAELRDQAVEKGGGNNVVNVILTDIRALDTWGEVLVIAVAATGVVALGIAGRRDPPEDGGERDDRAPGDGDGGTRGDAARDDDRTTAEVPT